MFRRLILAAAAAAAFSPALAQDAVKEPATKLGSPTAEATAPKVDAAKPADTEGATGGEGEAATTAEGEATAAAPTRDGPIGDGEPRALIMDIAGFSDPAIEAFDELNDGAEVKLEAKAELAMTFYPTCEDLTIRGGTFKISDGKLAIKDGEVLTRTKGECPGHVKLSPADVVNASIVTRTITPRPWISTDPLMIGLAGSKAGKYENIGVYSTDGKIFEAPLTGRGVVWPEGAAKLVPGEQYTIVLTGKDIQTFAARVSPDEKAPRVTVFRLN